MRSIQLASTLAMASTALAAPSIFPFFPFCTPYADTYDNLAASSNPTSPAPVGTYNGLTYTAFAVDQQGSSGVGGVAPQSAPNAATASLSTDYQTFGDLKLNPFGSIRNAPGVSYFNLNSFYFGCSVDTHDNNNLGQSSGCTISVVGYDYKGNQLPAQTFAYAPESSKNAAMSIATLPASYSLLTSVTFGIATGSIITPGTSLHLDNLSHCNYS